MTALEFIHKHQNDEDNGECLILPDGSVEEPLPSHIGRLVELTGMDAGALHGRMEKNMEPLFWLVEYTGCMSVWQTRVVAPTVPTGQQQAALEELHDAAFLDRNMWRACTGRKRSLGIDKNSRCCRKNRCRAAESIGWVWSLTVLQTYRKVFLRMPRGHRALFGSFPV